MNNKIYVGIDPGKDGAMSFLYPNGSVEVRLFPKIGTEYNVLEMTNIFKDMSIDPDYKYHVIIEDVKALQRPMDAGNWELSRGKTILEVSCLAFKVPMTMVHSKTWQKEMWQGIPEQREPSKTSINKKGEKVTKQGSVLTKEMSKLAATRLFPSIDFRNPDRKTERAKSLHTGVVDSLLIAEFGRRKKY